MKVLVDTSVWSLALRRKTESLDESEKKNIDELAELISESRVVMIGPIRQEILSGIILQNLFNQLKTKLRAFINLGISSVDHEKAAEFYNVCRSKGVQGSHIDFLICAVAHNYGLSIFTTDNDFQLSAEQIDINLYKFRDS